MPFACAMDQGAPRLARSSQNIYHISGLRQDLPFSSCAPSPSGTCEMMMVHKFTIECDGQRVAWSRIAASAKSLGIELPEHLPPGFAPVSRLQGRFVFSGPAPAAPPSITRVAIQDLSPDSVTTASIPRRRPDAAPWVTVVDPAAAATSGGGALKVAGVASSLLASLMAGCLLLARRRSIATLELSSLPAAVPALAGRAVDIFVLGVDHVATAFQHSYRSWQAASDSEGSDAGLENSLSVVHARLGETELLVATLPADLLLKDVLQSELDGLRNRAADVARRINRLGAAQVKAAVRSLLRDLDRITRIAHGAGQRSDEPQTASPDAPATVFEAYRVLGLNPEAPYLAVKKVVEALRMSWHPDRARSEVDRVYREERIKQINAAWDLVKSRHAATT